MCFILKVLFKAEGEEIELIEAVKTSSRGATAWGRIDFHCREPKSDPVTFTTRESHLVSIIYYCLPCLQHIFQVIYYKFLLLKGFFILSFFSNSYALLLIIFKSLQIIRYIL